MNVLGQINLQYNSFYYFWLMNDTNVLKSLHHLQYVFFRLLKQKEFKFLDSYL
jgi:hypothetical protein